MEPKGGYGVRMSDEEKILALLNSVQLAIADLKVYQFETNARLDKLEAKAKAQETDESPIIDRLDRLASTQAAYYEKTERLETKLLKVEAGQTYVNRKMDSLVVEDVRIQKNVTAAQDGYKEELKRISAELERLASVTKENVFNITMLKHT